MKTSIISVLAEGDDKEYLAEAMTDILQSLEDKSGVFTVQVTKVRGRHYWIVSKSPVNNPKKAVKEWFRSF